MKNYAIIALPEKKINDEIEELRIAKIGGELVDGLPPHVTVKCRFVLSDNFSEIDLVNYFKKLSLNKIPVNFIGQEKLGDALALIGLSDEMKSNHLLLVNDLEGKIKTKNPGWERDNYKVHMTLFRGLDNNIVFPEIKDVIFDRMALYELDPGVERLFAKEVAVIWLNSPVQ